MSTLDIHIFARGFVRSSESGSRVYVSTPPCNHVYLDGAAATWRSDSLSVFRECGPLQIISFRLPALHASSDQAVMPRTKEGSLTWYARNESQIVISWLSSSL
jgi:hypothetical protein